MSWLAIRGHSRSLERRLPAASYDSIQYTMRIKGNGTLEQFQEIHETVMKTSPNYFNISQPVTIDARMEILS